MIVEWFLDLVDGVMTWFFSLFDGWTIPSLIKSPSNAFGELVANANSMGVWVPWSVIGVSVGIALGAWVVLFLVKIIRQLFAHVPLVGGTG